MPGREILLKGADQGRRLHGRDQVIEEALLVRLERALRRRLGVPVVGGRALAGDVGGFQGFGQVLVNDLEGARVRVIDAGMRVCSGVSSCSTSSTSTPSYESGRAA